MDVWIMLNAIYYSNKTIYNIFSSVYFPASLAAFPALIVP